MGGLFGMKSGANLSLPLAHHFYKEVVLEGKNVFKVIRYRKKDDTPNLPSSPPPTHNNMTSFGVYAQLRFRRIEEPSDAYIDTILRSYRTLTPSQIEYWAKLYGSYTAAGSELTPSHIFHYLVRSYPKFDGDYASTQKIYQLLRAHPEWLCGEPPRTPSPKTEDAEASVTTEDTSEALDTSNALVSMPFARPLELSPSEKDLLILRIGLNMSIPRVNSTVTASNTWMIFQRIASRVAVLEQLPRVSAEVVEAAVRKVCERSRVSMNSPKSRLLLHLAKHATLNESFPYRRTEVIAWWERESRRADVVEDARNYISILLRNLSSLSLYNATKAEAFHYGKFKVQDNVIVSGPFQGVPVLPNKDGSGYELRLNQWTVHFLEESFRGSL